MRTFPERALFAQLSVSHEAWAKLEAYERLLKEWNQRFNLVAKSTLPALWERHFFDSAQIAPLLPPNGKVLVDMGSGAGFPGMVLAILCPLEVHLIESIGKKANFLRVVAQELDLNVTVHADRIEKVQGLKADSVTARALTALPDLLSLAKPFMKPESTALFLKGEKAEAELTQARKYWTFDLAKHRSQSDPSGVILQIQNLKVLRDYGPSKRSIKNK